MPGKAPPGFFTILDFMAMSDFEKQLALQEYRNMVQAGTMGVRSFAENPSKTTKNVKRKARRKKSAYGRALSKELKDINKKARTKSGKLRKGMTPGKILAKAHKAAKRRLK